MTAAAAPRVLADVGRRHRAQVRTDRGIVLGGIAAVGIGLLLFWQFGIGYIVNQRYISTPLEVGASLIERLGSGDLPRHIAATMTAAGGGYLIGIAVGLIGAFGLLMTRRGYEVLEPFLLAFSAIPKIALAPLFIMWFGLALTPKLLLAALMVFFIVFMNTISGVRHVDRGLVDVARVLGAGRLQLIRKIMLPAAAPSIMAAIRVTFARAIVHQPVHPAAAWRHHHDRHAGGRRTDGGGQHRGGRGRGHRRAREQAGGRARLSTRGVGAYIGIYDLCPTRYTLALLTRS